MTAYRDALATGAEGGGTLRQAWPMFRPFLGHMLAAAAVGILSTVAALLGPQALRIAIDDGVAADDTHVLGLAAGAFVACALVEAAAGWGFSILSVRVSEQVLHAFRMHVLERLLTLPLPFFEAHGTGELLARNVNDIQQLSSFARHTLHYVFSAVLFSTLGVTMLFATSLPLALVCLLVLPLPLLVLRRYQRLSAPVYARLAEADAQVVERLSEGLAGVDVTHAAHRFEWPLGRVNSAVDAHLAPAYESVRIENRTFPVVAFCNNIAPAFVVVVGGFLVARDVTTVGTVVACLAYVRLLAEPFEMVGDLVASAQEARVALARILSLDTLAPAAEGETPTPATDALTADAVSFAYEGGTPVVRGVSLRIEPGQRVALIGETGAGKTTLARLLAGLYQPSAGAVAVGGCDLRSLTRTALQQTVVMVPQGNRLFAGTVADNIRVVRPTASDEEVRAAFDAIDLGALIERLPAGIHTEVGRGGALLSAGQRQLLVLARLALLDPAVIILDESTSQIDPATERQLHASLGRLAEGRVLIVIAHRPSTIAALDVVYEMVAGQLHLVRGHVQ